MLIFYAYLADNYRKELISNAELASLILRVEEPNLLQKLRLAEQQQQWAEAQFILQALGEIYQRLGRKPEFKALRQRVLNQIGIHLSEAKAKGKGAFELWIYLRINEANEALLRADLEAARVIYQEILDELVALNDSLVNNKIADVYHQLGIVAQQQRQFEQAEQYYFKALKIKEDAGDFYSAANVYHQLGMVAEKQQQFEDAISYYQKAFGIYEQFQDWYKASQTLAKWARVLEAQSNFSEALPIYIRGFVIDIEHHQEFIRWYVDALARMLRVSGENQFDTIWREVTGEEGAGEVRKAIWAARDRFDKEG